MVNMVNVEVIPTDQLNENGPERLHIYVTFDHKCDEPPKYNIFHDKSMVKLHLGRFLYFIP